MECLSPGNDSTDFSDAAEFADTASFHHEMRDLEQDIAEDVFPMDSMGFNVIDDDESPAETQTNTQVDRAMLVDPDRGMGSSGVWECNICWYLNTGEICGGCNQTFDQSQYTRRLGLFSASPEETSVAQQAPPEDQPDLEPRERAAQAEQAYNTKLEASAADLAQAEIERKRVLHHKQMQEFAREKQLVVQKANEEALMLREKMLQEAEILSVEAEHQKAQADAEQALQQAKLEASKILAEAVLESAQVQREAREAMAEVISKKQLAARPLWHHADTVSPC
jgi:hypothetical protein